MIFGLDELKTNVNFDCEIEYLPRVEYLIKADGSKIPLGPRNLNENEEYISLLPGDCIKIKINNFSLNYIEVEKMLFMMFTDSVSPNTVLRVVYNDDNEDIIRINEKTLKNNIIIVDMTKEFNFFNAHKRGIEIYVENTDELKVLNLNNPALEEYQENHFVCYVKTGKYNHKTILFDEINNDRILINTKYWDHEFGSLKQYSEMSIECDYEIFSINKENINFSLRRYKGQYYDVLNTKYVISKHDNDLVLMITNYLQETMNYFYVGSTTRDGLYGKIYHNSLDASYIIHNEEQNYYCLCYDGDKKIYIDFYGNVYLIEYENGIKLQFGTNNITIKKLKSDTEEEIIIDEISISNSNGKVTYHLNSTNYIECSTNEIKTYQYNVLVKHLLLNNIYEEKVNNYKIESYVPDVENRSDFESNLALKYVSGKTKLLKIKYIPEDDLYQASTFITEDENGNSVSFAYDSYMEIKEIIDVKDGFNKLLYPKTDMYGNRLFIDQMFEILPNDFRADNTSWNAYGIVTEGDVVNEVSIDFEYIRNTEFANTVGNDKLKLHDKTYSKKILRKIIDCHILPKESWRIALSYKAYIANGSDASVKVTFCSPISSEYDFIIEKPIHSAYYYYQVFDETFTAKRRYSKVIIEIITNDVIDIWVGKTFFYKARVSVTNKYDEYNNIQATEAANNIIEYIYKDNIVIGYKSSCGDYYIVDKNLDRTIEYNYMNGNKTISEYDQYDRIVRKTLHNPKQLSDVTEYIYDNTIKENVTKIIKDNKTIDIYYNENNQVSSECLTVTSDDESIITKTNSYVYDQNDIIQKSSTVQKQNDESNDISQYTINYLKTNIGTEEFNGYNYDIVINQINYDINVDKYNRVELCKLNSVTLNELTYKQNMKENIPTNKVINDLVYNEYSHSYVYNENRLVQHKVGDKATIYSYTLKSGEPGYNLSKTTYGKLYSIEAPVNEYNMDVLHTTSYQYDHLNRVKKKLDHNYIFNYQYDDGNNLKYKGIHNNFSQQHYFYNHINESKRNDIYGLIGRLNTASINDYVFPNDQNQTMYGCTFSRHNVEYVFDESISKMVYSLPENSSYMMFILSNLNKNRIDGNEYLGIKYDKDQFKYKLNNEKVVSMWIKVTKNDDIYKENELYISTFGNAEDGIIKIKMDHENNIKLYLLNDMIDTGLTIIPDEWNYFEISVSDVLNIRVNNYNRIFNINIQECVGNVHTIKIGNGVGNESYTKANSILSILFISIGCERLIPLDELELIDEAYKYIKNKSEYLFDQTMIYHSDNNSTYIPLNGAFVNHKLPSDYEVIKNVSEDNNQDLFYYDADYKQYVYCSKLGDSIQSLLGYNFELGNNYAINVNIKILDFTNPTSKEYIISNYDSTKAFNWGIAIDTSGQIQIISGSQIYETSIELKLDKWYNISIISTNDIFYINVDNIDTNIEENTYTIIPYMNQFSLEDNISYIGSQVDYINGYAVPKNNMNGFINSIEYVDEINDNVLPNIIEKFDKKPIIISNEYDIDNRLKQRTITTKNTKLNNYYRYYQTSKVNYLLTAEYNCLNETINYEYDDFDNVIVKEIANNSGDILEKYNYEYDSWNRLKKETKYIITEHGLSLDYEYQYSYDLNGNITQKVKNNEITSFVYATNSIQNLNTDVLICVSKSGIITTFLYDSIKGPKKIITDDVETNITWENDKLIGYGNILFEYNELGQRIKKTSTSNVTNYYYDDDLLIRSEKNNIVFDYLYDINNQLIGFIYDNQEYIYVRDILGNINKIVDSIGCIMVNYNYTAYGEVTISNPYSDTHEKYQLANVIIENNIFLYKGYCYDVETGWFWLSSRYYSPELCRFISPDDVEYLDPKSVNGLNLYCYCLNNPISYADPSGHFVITTAALIAGLVAVGKAMLIGAAIGAAVGAGFEFGKQLYQNGGDFSSLDLGAIGMAALGGAVSGAISAIPIPGSGFLSYLGTFAIGGAASIAGGLVTGSVNSWETAALAFGIGGVAGVIGRGASDIVKHIKVSKQIGAISNKAQSIASMSAKNKSLAIWNMVGADNFSRNAFKSWGYNQIFDLLMTEGTNQLLINSTSNLTRYLVYSSLVSSLGSGWF